MMLTNRLLISKLTFIWLCFSLLMSGCNRIPSQVEVALNVSGQNRIELEKVINHYQHLGDQQKLLAAFYLIENLPNQYHYEGYIINRYQQAYKVLDSLAVARKGILYSQVWDSLQTTLDSAHTSNMRKVRDIETIKASFLIQNIDEAFTAWQYPWSRGLSFDEFCEYLLPYKLKNELPTHWRPYFQTRYKWLSDSLGKKIDPQQACSLINRDLSKWFYLTKLSAPYDLSFTDLLYSKSGRCPQEVQFAAYAMRAMGLPVTLDKVPLWGNRSFQHDWNGLIIHHKTIPFLGTEVDPGLYKIEFAMPGSLKSKRAKIFRRTYAYQHNSLLSQVDNEQEIPELFRDSHYIDVTEEYVPVTDVYLPKTPILNGYQYAYLCVFNYLDWRPIAWGPIQKEKIMFKAMGRDIVYLPMLYDEDGFTPITRPFLLQKNGKIRYFNKHSTHTQSLTITRKYPSGEDNKIIRGNHYQLFYWDNHWKSLGKQTAVGDSLVYPKVPVNALFWLRHQSKGFQERIFTIENGKIAWW